mgnify:FL=1
MPERLLTPLQAAKFLGVSPRTLANWRSRGGGPKYTKLGNPPPQGRQDRRPVRYRLHDLETYGTTLSRTEAR